MTVDNFQTTNLREEQMRGNQAVVAAEQGQASYFPPKAEGCLQWHDPIGSSLRSPNGMKYVSAYRVNSTRKSLYLESEKKERSRINGSGRLAP